MEAQVPEKKEIVRDAKGRIVPGSASLNVKGQNAGTRHKGTLIKLAFYEAFNRIGGMEELVKWINKTETNKKEFFKMLLQVLPKELDVKAEGLNETKVIIVQPKEEKFGRANISRELSV